MSLTTNKPRRAENTRGAWMNANAGSGMRSHSTARRALRHESAIPSNWRDRLPDPAIYYAAHVGKLTRANGTGWAQGVCPFHDDHSASLSVHVADPRGGWRCFAGCGGGDLVSFHERLCGLDFKAAVRELVGVRS